LSQLISSLAEKYPLVLERSELTSSSRHTHKKKYPFKLFLATEETMQSALDIDFTFPDMSPLDMFHMVRLITSKLVWDCYQSLIQVAKHNRVQLIWVSSHEGIVCNETADQLARTGSEYPLIGPEPACGITIGVAKKAVRDWTNRNHKKKKNHWESTTRLKQAKGLVPSAGRTRDLWKNKQRPVKMGGRTIYRTLSPKRTPFQTVIDR
jgi:hypothetical protein